MLHWTAIPLERMAYGQQIPAGPTMLQNTQATGMGGLFHIDVDVVKTDTLSGT